MQNRDIKRMLSEAQPAFFVAIETENATGKLSKLIKI